MVDVQNDFCPGGALAVPRGDEVVPIVNRLQKISAAWSLHRVGIRPGTCRLPRRIPANTIAAPYGPQVLWPDHCVQGTRGAAFHDALRIPHAGLVLRKGLHRIIDSYSAFYENDRATPTGLAYVPRLEFARR